MDNSGSFSIILSQLKAGDEDAVRKLWDRFFEPLRRVAASRLPNRQRRSVGAEDLALSTIEAFQRGFENDRFSRVQDRNDVWALLTSIIDRKIIDHLRSQQAAKRGGGNLRGESFFAQVGDGCGGISDAAAIQLDHECAVEIIDQLEMIYRKLDDPELVRVINARLEGCTVEETANLIGKSVSSVERKLRLAREIWREAERQ